MHQTLEINVFGKNNPTFKKKSKFWPLNTQKAKFFPIEKNDRSVRLNSFLVISTSIHAERHIILRFILSVSGASLQVWLSHKKSINSKSCSRLIIIFNPKWKPFPALHLHSSSCHLKPKPNLSQSIQIKLNFQQIPTWGMKIKFLNKLIT